MFAWYQLAKVSILVSLEIFLQLSSFTCARWCFKLPARRSTVSIAIRFSWLAWIEKANLAADWVFGIVIFTLVFSLLKYKANKTFHFWKAFPEKHLNKNMTANKIFPETLFVAVCAQRRCRSYFLLLKALMSGLIRSIGSGNIIVEFFSAAILFKVWKRQKLI